MSAPGILGVMCPGCKTRLFVNRKVASLSRIVHDGETNAYWHLECWPGEPPIHEGEFSFEEFGVGNSSALEEPMTGWATIDTAPKDGQRILLFCVTRFRNDNHVAQSVHVASWDGKDFSDHLPGNIAVYPHATHWMPLPAPPSVTKA